MSEAKVEPWPHVRIIFLRTTGVMAALTRWITRCPANHMYLEVPMWGHRVVCEAATQGGVRLVAQPQAGRVVAAYACRFDPSPGLDYVVLLLGRSYDYWGTIPIAVAHLAWRWFKIRLWRWRWSTRAIKCSELAVLFCRACGLSMAGLSAEMAAPSDLLWWCRTQIGWFDQVKGSPDLDRWAGPR